MSEQGEISTRDLLDVTDSDTPAVIPFDQLRPEDIKPGQEVGGLQAVKDLDKVEAVIAEAMQHHLDATKNYKNNGLHINNTPGFLSDVIQQELPDGYNRTRIDNIRLSVDPVDEDIVNLVNDARSETDPGFVNSSDVRVVTVTRDLHYAGTDRTVSTKVAYFPQSRMHGTMKEPRPYIYRVVKKGEGTDLHKMNQEIVAGREKSLRRVKNNQRRPPMSAGLPTLGKRR